MVTAVGGVVFCSVAQAQVFDRFPDFGNGFLLGDNKGNDHFPEVLLQDPDSRAGFGCGQKIAVFFINGILKSFVISGTIKIVFPENQVFFRAVESDQMVFLRDAQESPAAYDIVGIMFRKNRYHAEALTGVGNLPKIEIRISVLSHGTIIPDQSGPVNGSLFGLASICMGKPDTEKTLFHFAPAERNQRIDITFSCYSLVEYDKAYGKDNPSCKSPEVK